VGDSSGSRTAIDRAARTPPRPDPAVVTATFTRHCLGKVCTLVRSIAVDAGIAPRDIRDLLIAVSEIATNAIRYAGGAGSITLRRVADGLLVEISDNGPGLPDDLLMERPPQSALDGRGLWLARVLCRDFDIVSCPRGVTVRIFTPRRAAAWRDWS
jgi:anti-sigma regulatory factor (Ser/Thr protein kinase)